MNQELHQYLEYELRFLRNAIVELADSDPAIAQRLQIDQDGVGYADVERIVHGAALLNARTAAKIEDRNSASVAALLELLYPHFLRPIPSLALLQFELDESRYSQPSVPIVAANHQIQTTHFRTTDNGQDFSTLCQFRLCKDVNLLPVKIVATTLSGPPYGVESTLPANETISGLSFQLQHLGTESSLSDVGFESHLEIAITESHNNSFELFSFLFRQATAVTFHEGDTREPFAVFGADAISPVGMRDDERLLEHDARTFFGFALLTEFMSYSMAFNRVRLKLPDLSRVNSRSVRVCIFFKAQSSTLESVIQADWLKVNCFPVINLGASDQSVSVPFDQGDEAIPLVVPSEVIDHPNDAMTLDLREEIYSIQKVMICNRKTLVEKEILPEYHVPYPGFTGETDRFAAQRRFVLASDGSSTIGSDVFVRTSWRPPSRLEDNGKEWFYRVEVQTLNRIVPTMGTLRWTIDEPVTGVSARTIRNPLPPVRRFRAAADLWQFVNQVAINQTSLLTVDGLSSLLRLYGHPDQVDNSKVARCIQSVSSERSVERVTVDGQPAFVRSLTVNIVIDGQEMSPGWSYLVASILAVFILNASSVNTFMRLRVTDEAGDELGVWCRNGVRPDA